MKYFEIDSIAFIGRTLEEYVRMFDLNTAGLPAEKILDCPGGACSFAAEAGEKGVKVIAADMLYGTEPDKIKKLCEDELEKVFHALNPVKDQYRWDFYGNVQGLKKRRVSAYTRFIEDYSKNFNGAKYVRCDLPTLPFSEGEFSLVLSAHLLFLYSDRLSYEFHLSAASELLRVSSREVRIFPVVGLDSKKSPYLDPLAEDLRAKGFGVELKRVPFEFQKGGSLMLRILK